ncbi:MAG: efflux RND transporter permease subunit [Rhodospirillaceae bacterium]
MSAAPRPRTALANRASGLPALAVRRPVLIVVVNLLIILAGLAAITGVEVRELPNVDRPVVTVRANWPGAAPETVDAQATSVLEGAVARVSGVQEIRSSSEENNLRIRVSFHPDVDLNTAAADVREAVASAERRLPSGVEDVTVVKADADASPVLRVALTSDSLSVQDLTRLAEDDIAPNLASVPGVATVDLFGDREQVLRVLVDPLRLASYGLTIQDVAAVLEHAEFDVPAGSFKSDDQLLIVRADATVTEADEIERLELRDNVSLGDVARVVKGPANPVSMVRLDGQTVVGMNIIRQARSNTIAISEGVHAAVERLNARLGDARLQVTSDDALFIQGSVNEVLRTLLLTTAIVVGILWLFLGALRPTLIPAVTIPVALVGTVAAIWGLGFSINILTLLALVLATGMIVDDAIVVLENIQRMKAQGHGAYAAAVLGARQVFFAVLATTATLVSVFVPIAFLPGMAGRLFTEFGFVLAIAMAISSFVALTLAPMMASKLPSSPKSREEIPPEPSPHLLARTGRRLASLYANLLDRALAAPWVVLGVSVLGAGLAWGVYQTLDQELVPPEDRGFLFVSMKGPDGVGIDYIDRQVSRVEDVVAPLVEEGLITGVYAIVGRWDPNRAFLSLPLAPWDQRDESQFEIRDRVRALIGSPPGATVWVGSGNSLNLRGTSAGGLRFAVQGPRYPAIAEASDVFIERLQDEMPGVNNLRLSYEPTQPQLTIRVDRRKAEDLGVPVEGLRDTLRAMVDGYEVAELNIDDRAVPILLQSVSGAINDPGDLENLFVAGAEGRMIPLSAVVTIREEGIAAELDRIGQKRAIEVDAELSDGFTLAEAVSGIYALANEMLPPGFSVEMVGEAAVLEETSREVQLTFAIAILVVLLVLAAQFESLTSALVVVLTVPFGLAAAIYALALTGTSLNIYSQIGLIMLIGLMAKNGILIVEFANQLRDAGRSVSEAVREAAVVRLRPVMMTMLSTVLGGLPLVLSTGPGAESRHAIGWVVFGGLGFATLFTLFLAPVFYALLAPLSKPRADAEQRLQQELDSAPDPIATGTGARSPAE